MRKILSAIFLLALGITSLESRDLERAPQGLAELVRVDREGRRALPPGFGARGERSGQRGVPAPGWTSLGPFGGDVGDVGVSPTAPTVALAGLATNNFSGNLYRSTDGGTTWALVPDLSGIDVFDVEFAADGTAYIGTFDGVWKSTDDGATWTALPLGIGLNVQVLGLALEPGAPGTVWIGIADAIGSQSVNMMRSTDAGATWSDVTPPLASPISCTGIAFDPTDTKKVYATFAGGFGGGQVWVSADGGATWANRSAGLPNRPMNDVVHDGARILVGGGQNFGSQFVGVYASSDEGLTWTALHDGTWTHLVVTDLELDPNDPSRIFVTTDGAGLNRSADGGATWQTGIGGTGAMALNAVSFAPGSSSTVFLGASSFAVLRSGDGGDAFDSSSTGISGLDVFSVAVNPNDTDELAAAFQGLNNGGVYTSTDGGQTWSLEPVPPTRYITVAFSPDGTLHAISEGPSSVAPEGLYRRDAPGTWSSLGPDQGGLFESELAAIRFSRNDPDLILLGGADFGVAGSEATVWRSTDRGQSWTKVYEGSESGEHVNDLEIAEDSTDLLMLASYTDFAGNAVAGGALRTTDGGLTWRPFTAGLPADAEATALCASPTDPETFYLTDRGFPNPGGLYKTTDGGLNWTGTGYSDSALLDVICDPRSDELLYMAQTGATVVFRSEDEGVSFSGFNEGLETGVGARRMAFVGGASPQLYLATTRGTYRRALPLFEIFTDGFESGNTSAWSAAVP